MNLAASWSKDLRPGSSTRTGMGKSESALKSSRQASKLAGFPAPGLGEAARSQMKKTGRTQKGQSLVEFVFALPFLILAIVAIIYFGKAFYTKQMLCFAAQECARFAARVPNLSDPSVRDAIRGFTTDGALIGEDDPSSNISPIYRALSSAHMLSGDDGAHGNLPPGSTVKILPWDDDQSSTGDTVKVEISYPFGLMVDPRTGTSSDKFGDSVNISFGTEGPETAVPFANTTITEAASAAQEVYQQ